MQAAPALVSDPFGQAEAECSAASFDAAEATVSSGPMRRVTALSSCVAVTRVDPAEAGVKLTRPKQVSGEGGVTCDFRRM